MDFYLINYVVHFGGEGKSNVEVADMMVVPAKTDKAARALFTATMEKTPILLMTYKNTRLLMPLKEYEAQVTIKSSSKL